MRNRRLSPALRGGDPPCAPPVLPSQLCSTARALSVTLLLQRHRLRQTPGLFPRGWRAAGDRNVTGGWLSLSSSRPQSPSLYVAVPAASGQHRFTASEFPEFAPSPKSSAGQGWGERGGEAGETLALSVIAARLLGQVNPEQLRPARQPVPLACRRHGAEGHPRFTKQALQGQAWAPTKWESKQTSLGFVSCRVTHLEYIYHL